MSNEAKAPPSQTLFVRDIPNDIETKELEELFSKYSGFIAFRRLLYFSFIEFDSVENAAEALKFLQGFRLRTEDRGFIVDFDKAIKNKSRKRDDSLERTNERERSRDSERQRDRDRRDYRPTRRPYESRYVNDYMFQQPPWNPESGRGGVISFPNWSMNHFPSYPNMGARNSEQCSTLFISGLPKDVTERELSIMFRLLPSFTNYRLVTREGKTPFCFADFADPPSAYGALHFLQGFKMDERDSYGLYIEFDKNSKRAAKKSF
eukprot:TRINITY_DN3845_c0_g7_i1.p1 TRINITY_DN3845_c0_g7~~TRINITY_DN3845_c0_g7_i1.p1  ORF type:complete len:278 (+),score=102.25 TRINITY_DN3845_c0_g7_i1:47-835(+)